VSLFVFLFFSSACGRVLFSVFLPPPPCSPPLPISLSNTLPFYLFPPTEIRVEYFNGNSDKYTVGTFMPFQTQTSPPSVAKGDLSHLNFATPVTATSIRIVVIQGWNAMNAGLLDTCLPCVAGKYTCSNAATQSAMCVECISGKYLKTNATHAHKGIHMHICAHWRV